MSFVNGKKSTFDRNVFGGIFMKKVLYSLWLPLFFMTMYIFVHPGPAFSKIDKNKDSQEQVVENRPTEFIGTFENFERLHERDRDITGYVLTIAQNSKGDLYVVQESPPKVLVFDKEGKFLFSFGEQGDEDGQFRQLYSIAIDNEDMVYVSDLYHNKILVFTPRGFFVEEFFSRAEFLKNTERRTIQTPNIGSFAINKRNNRLYISSPLNGHIQVYNLKGKFLHYIGEKKDYFCTPGTPKFDNHNKIYVPETLCDRVRVFDEEGKQVLKIGKGSGDLAGQFSRLNGIDVDSQGRVYTVDVLLKCIQIFSPEGDFIGAIKWLDHKGERIYFKRLTNLFIGEDDLMYLIDRKANQVYIVKDNNPI